MASRKKRGPALKSAGRKARGTVVLSRQHQTKRKTKAGVKKRSSPVRRKKAAQRAQWVTFGNQRRVLALDVSSKAVGWALFEHGALHQHGLYQHVGEGHGERLVNYLEWLSALFRIHKPTTVTSEAPFQGRHRYAFAVLTLYRAALLVAHMRHYGVELGEENQIPAHLIKRVLDVPKGSHTENKARVVAIINELYHTSFKFDADRPTAKDYNEDDIADAVAVGHAWYVLHDSLVEREVPDAE